MTQNAEIAYTNQPSKGTRTMSVVNPIDLDSLTLKAGAHDPSSAEMCVMEAVAYVAGEAWSDHPQCASPVISEFMRSWNDTLPDEDRNRLLKPYVTRLVGTAASAEVEDRRAWMALDWLVRVHAPAWLRLAGLTDQADRLAGLPEFVAGMDVPSIRPIIDAVRQDAAAAGDAAWAAAWAAAGAAARDAARAAAGDAAGAAARDAARDAAGDAAGDAARAAAGDAAGAAAWAAAGAAAGAAAARAAAWERLKPVVDELQPLALALIDRMIACGD